MSYRLQQAVLAVSLLAGLAATGCKHSTSGALKDQAPPASATPSAGLDVNDVSLLLPLPSSAGAVGTMLPLSLSNADGLPLMSEALFNDVLGHFKYKATIDGETVPLNAGADFAGDNVAAGPFNRYTDWKIVALRYDACVGTAAPGAAPHAPPAAEPSDATCAAQLRVTVQPVMHRSRTGRSGAHIDDDAPRVADYALHLIFALTKDESRRFYADLVAFRQSCGDLTTGLPLGVHPCLLAEKLRGAYGGPATQEVAGMLRQYARHYTGLAAMATRNGADPWLFMNGTVAADRFVHQPIETLRKEQDLRRNGAGRLLESFHNGYFQQLTFTGVGIQVADDGRRVDPNPNAVRVTPLAVPDKTATSLNQELNRNLGERAAFFAKINALENPQINHFRSTDCVSCHAASDTTNLFAFNDEMGAYFMQFNSVAVSRHDPNMPILSRSDDHVGATAMHARAAAAHFYRPGPGYTNMTDNLSSSTVANFLDNPERPYNIVHFAYFEAGPAISQRAVQESAKAAHDANALYAAGQPPAPVCATEELRSCLATKPVRFWNQRRPGLPREVAENLPIAATMYCMQKVCPERAKTLQPLIAPLQLKKYRANADIGVATYRGGAQFALAQGTEFFGVALGDGVFTSPGLIPLRGGDGKGYFALYEITADGNWQQDIVSVP